MTTPCCNFNQTLVIILFYFNYFWVFLGGLVVPILLTKVFLLTYTCNKGTCCLESVELVFEKRL